jgi:hypothetical protein
MRRMILRMIATGSLSAFSAAALHGPGRLGGAVQPARTPALPEPAAAAPSPSRGTPSSAAPQPGRALPRGSLLDLSV